MKDNYIKIEPFMIKKLRLSGYDLLVYAIIYGFTKSSGEYIGGYRYMTKEFGFDKSTIYRALCRLKTVNLIEVEKVGTSLRIVCNMQTIDKYANCIQTVCKTHTEEYAGRIQTVCKMQPKNTNNTNNTNVITADSLSISARNIYNGSADEKTDDSTTENAETSSNAVATTENTGAANTDTLDSYEEVLDYLFTNEYDETTAKTVAVGAAIANNTLAGVGSEVLNQITNTTKAHLDEGKYSVTGGLSVDAQREAYIFGLAGGLSAAKNVGIGASVDYEDINITTEAYVGDKVNVVLKNIKEDG